MKQVRFIIVGGGVMGETIVTSLLSAKIAPAAALTVVEPNEARARELVKNYKIKAVSSYEQLATSEVVILAVKAAEDQSLLAEIYSSVFVKVLLILMALQLKM